jgi:putative peptide zinc metalloprotease protein
MQTKRIPFRRRADLVTCVHQRRGDPVYVVKDPLALKYYHFGPQEHAILNMLDGRATLEAISRQLAAEFPETPISRCDIEAFIASLYGLSLVLGEGPQQGRLLVARRDQKRRQERTNRLTNVLFIRCPGFDPTWLLDRLYPLTWWFFTRWSIFGVAVLVCVALMVATARMQRLPSEILAMHEYFGPGNWLLLALTLATTKILHEFGHALTCRRCGGECHEIGVMLLVLTPCLYCDVSDSWLLPSKWQRAAIAAGGMYVEVMLASLAALVWAHTIPGTLHYLALQVMLICSASTLLFNGNPLARYDGYYILTDLVNIPNLREEARTALWAILWRALLGVTLPGSPPRPSWKLAMFGAGVVIYRWLLLASVLWALHFVLAAQGLEVLWQVIAVLTLFAALVLPAWRWAKKLCSKEVRDQMSRRKKLTVAAACGATIAVIAFVPLPRRIVCTFEIRAAGAAPVYAPQSARLEQVFVKPGDPVRQGQALASLNSIDLQLAVSRLRTAAGSQQLLLEALRYERFQNPHAAAALPQATELLEATSQQLSQRQGDLAKLKLTAPQAGVVFVPLRRERPADDVVLAYWSGSPLDQRNWGCTLTQGDVVCEIGDPHQREAVLVIDQADIEGVELGQQVRLALDAQPLQRYRGKITDISRDKLAQTPDGLSVQAGGSVPSHTDRGGVTRPASPSYSACVQLEDLREPLPVGLRGTARVTTSWQTLGRRAWQYICRTFQFSW